MKFQVDQGWLIAGTLIPGGTILDFVGKADHELSPWETIAKNRIPPITALALDYDSALTLWANYPWHRDRLRRQLHPTQEAEFLRLRDDWTTLQRFWPRGRG